MPRWAVAGDFATLFPMVEIEPITFGIAIVGAVTGVIGTGLSIWSVYRDLDRERVKLKVVPYHTTPVGPEGSLLPHTMSIDVTNLSTFPVSLAHIGILYRDSTDKGFCLEMSTLDGGPVRRRMEPRTTVSVMFPPEFIRDPKFGRVRCAFVKTVCGEQFEGTSGALDEMVKDAQHGMQR